MNLNPPIKSLLTPNRSLSLLPSHHRKRNRIRLRRIQSIGPQSLFRELVEKFPSVNSLELIAPVLGLASGAALYLSRIGGEKVRDVGEWVLFTSPTPFNRFVVLRCPSIALEESLFRELVTHFPSVNSLELIAPVLGLASGAALYLSKIGRGGGEKVRDVEEWVLFTSPTPFNRFVVLRCPSIALEGNELLEEANDKLVKEERHFVRLDRGRIQVRDDDDVAEKKLVYQRVCLSTDDGGVISLDWPANLELTEEHGLDTTLLLIPGNTEGSMDKNVRSLVCESLRRGCFPIVMNPRGCAGSPLTSARLFTAADSDDISTAVQYISKARPWTTMMGVGWGYGANMLTKYLAEVGEGTPLTAATCINNPFDLEEATRSSPHNLVLDDKLTGGLVDILQANKELFQGRAKGFDVEKALRANSVRDFEKAISMVSYGYDAIADFYENSSTRCVVGEVKIPVLFIQNDDGLAPLFSIPRDTIAENQYTSLLLCSCSSSGIATVRPALNWCHQLSIEWLAAVELGLLKGHHPLLNDVDLALNPSKGLATVIRRETDRHGRVDKLLDLSRSDSINGYNGEYSLGKMVGEGDISARMNSKQVQNSQRNSELKNETLQPEGNDSSEHKRPIDAVIMEDEAGPETDTAQVLQAARVVINMLDVAMPGTLTEEQKKKVLTAVGQGETVMKALQDVVPEDVRGKLQSAVSGFLHTEKANLKLEKLLNINLIPRAASGHNPKVQENVGSTKAGEHENPPSPEPKDRADSVSNSTGSNEVSAAKQSIGLEPEVQGTDPQVTASENTVDKRAEPDSSGQLERKSDSVDQNGGPAKLDLKEGENIQQKVEAVPEDIADQHKKMLPSKEDQGLSQAVSSSDIQTVEKESLDTQPPQKEGSASVHVEEGSMQPVSIQGSNDAIFKVSQAFDALSGIDDSTQVAVNSVFGVIENMITQFEEGQDEETKGHDNNNQVLDKEVKEKEDEKNKQSLQYNKKEEFSSHDEKEVDKDAKLGSKEEKRTKNIPEKYLNESVIGTSLKPTTRDHVDGEGDEARADAVSSNILSQHSNNNGQYHPAPVYVNSNPHSKALYQEYLRKYLLLKMQSTESLDLNTTTALFLDYFPEEGQWKLLDQPDVNHQSSNTSPLAGELNEVIEPSYVIMDSEQEHDPILENDKNEKYISIDTSEQLIALVKKVVVDALKIEVGRRLSAADSEDMLQLMREVEQVGNAVSMASGCSKNHKSFSDGKDFDLEKVGTLDGEEIVNAISLSIQETNYLRKMIPLGVILGSCLASLRKKFNVATMDGADLSDEMALNQIDLTIRRKRGVLARPGTDTSLHGEPDHECYDSGSKDGENDKIESESVDNGSVMVGAFTAALGASALLGHKEMGMKDSSEGDETFGPSSKSFEDSQDVDKPNEEKSENELLSTLAEKAMSVASPVVPMKEDGGVDQDRLVAMLAEWGQRGGMLRLVGKIALLWGGMRGAMSLTDRLIQFLRIAERPLVQRMLAFVCMVLVLWAPIVVPLLPSLVSSWGSQNTPKFSQLVCVAGLYASIMILVTLWGKRIRGYENPYEQYGLDLTSSHKMKNYLMGLIGGVFLVLSINSVNAFLGIVHLSWPSIFISSHLQALTRLKVICKMVLVVGQGLISATGVAVVEELLFRSWLPDEIAADFGHNHGIIISALAFALFQRSPLAIPGLFLLSLGLSGARYSNQGSLSVSIGLHAGIMATSFYLETGGILKNNPNFPLWVTGSRPSQPLCNVVGLAFALLFAVLFYPSNPLLHQDIKKREIRD